jgi:hypothetical protein
VTRRRLCSTLRMRTSSQMATLLVTPLPPNRTLTLIRSPR